MVGYACLWSVNGSFMVASGYQFGLMVVDWWLLIVLITLNNGYLKTIRGNQCGIVLLVATIGGNNCGIILLVLIINQPTLINRWLLKRY